MITLVNFRKSKKISFTDFLEQITPVDEKVESVLHATWNTQNTHETDLVKCEKPMRKHTGLDLHLVAEWQFQDRLSEDVKSTYVINSVH